MPDAASEPRTSDRLDRIERQVAEIRRRLDELEQALTNRPEHPVDRTMVRQKVVFDWQA